MSSDYQFHVFHFNRVPVIPPRCVCLTVRGKACNGKPVVQEKGRWLCQKHKTQTVVPPELQCASMSIGTDMFRGHLMCHFHKNLHVEWLLEHGQPVTVEERRRR